MSKAACVATLLKKSKRFGLFVIVLSFNCSYVVDLRKGIKSSILSLSLVNFG